MLGHGPVCELIGQSELKKLSFKKRLVITRVRNLARLSKEACWGQDFDPMVGVDNTGSKSDGGNMPLSRGPQAEDKTQSVRRRVRLVGVRDNRRIEQCCRFQGVFANEIRTNQQLALFRNHLIGHHKVADLFEPLQELFLDLLVSLGEFSRYLIQERPDLIFRKRHDPGDNSARSLGILVSERTEKNAGLVRA